LIDNFDTKKVYGNSARDRISTQGADISPKWEYIRTPSADMNELSAILGRTRVEIDIATKLPKRGGVS